MHPKAYFLLPNADIAPGTLVQLGQIIPSLKEPHRPIGRAQGALNSYTSSKADYSLSTSASNSVGVGLMAQFLAQLGSPLSGGVTLERGTTTTTDWHFKTLETVYFEPDAAYVNRCIQDASVKTAMNKSRWSVIYVVTGLKIARGASYSTSDSHKLEGTAQLSVDATALAGVPLSAGPEASLKSSRAQKESCVSCSDFVWAVRVRKVKLTFWKKEVKTEDIYGGDLHSIDDEPGEVDFAISESSEEEEERKIVGGEMENWDMGATFEPKGFVKETVADEFGEECAACWQLVED
ncbi:hypothetical protein K491DRAFT_698749 [Lophiostoma macrostomum CBS 122681]|uniref:Uncharacterized protein n=1 Tax=Lophiostoma macrostomum CBS 122681 TaxID=1314788 RepID=A0A6A6SR74_9PLEO|nr:hypothetical protein K491DRAFT_698749 [Lophiostoma macrostomum CBS 122681]